MAGGCLIQVTTSTGLTVFEICHFLLHKLYYFHRQKPMSIWWSVSAYINNEYSMYLWLTTHNNAVATHTTTLCCSFLLVTQNECFGSLPVTWHQHLLGLRPICKEVLCTITLIIYTGLENFTQSKKWLFVSFLMNFPF